jgi:hypothetical protein
VIIIKGATKFPVFVQGLTMGCTLTNTDEKEFPVFAQGSTKGCPLTNNDANEFPEVQI